MLDTDSEPSSYPKRSESKSEGYGKSTNKSTICNRDIYTSPQFADSTQIQSSTKLGISLSTRSAHAPSNRVGSVPLEKAESCKGENFLASPTLTDPQIDTPPTLSCHRGWAMGRGRGQPRVGANFSTIKRAEYAVK